MKKTLLAAMLFIGLGAAGFAQTYGDFTVKPNYDGTVTITKYEGWDTVLNIPSSIGGKTVTAIGKGAFRECGLTSVVIPDTVRAIDDWAFYGNQLTSVTLGANVVGAGTYDSSVFGDFFYFNYICNDRQARTYRVDMNWNDWENTKETEGFQYIETPYGVAITGYTGTQKRLVIPETLKGKPVKYINGLNEKGLTAVRIPNTVTTLGDMAFYSNQLTNVVIPDGVIVIGSYAFAFNQLTSVTIPNSVTHLSGFLGNKLTSVIIPNSVIVIGSCAFSGNQLTSLVIPDSVKVIENNNGTYDDGIGFSGAFSGNKLTSVIIPNSIITIGSAAFSMNFSLREITVDPRNMAYTSVDGVLFDKAGKTLVMYPWGKSSTYSIPNGVTSIADFAFAGCTNLTSITIPAGITSIGDNAFTGCTNLTSIIIPTGITSIGWGAFTGCTNLTSIIIPAGITSIGGWAFIGCTNLTSITIPASLGQYAFMGVPLRPNIKAELQRRFGNDIF